MLVAEHTLCRVGVNSVMGKIAQTVAEPAGQADRMHMMPTLAILRLINDQRPMNHMMLTLSVLHLIHNADVDVCLFLCGGILIRLGVLCILIDVCVESRHACACCEHGMHPGTSGCMQVGLYVFDGAYIVPLFAIKRPHQIVVREYGVFVSWSFGH